MEDVDGVFVVEGTEEEEDEGDFRRQLWKTPIAISSKNVARRDRARMGR